MKEQIRHAAVIAENGMTILGKSHADCIYKAGNIGLKVSGKADLQGFFTSAGRFVTRREGAKIAVEAGQVRQGVEILFSEDLWSPQADGQFEYDYVKGYY